MVITRALRAFLFFATFGALSLLPAQENIVTLQETLARGQAALAAGDYASALTAFKSIETTFGREPEVKEKIFRLTIQPLHAYAALQSGETETAIRLFEAFVQDFPDDRSRLSFVLFNLARAYSEVDQKNEPARPTDATDALSQ